MLTKTDVVKMFANAMNSTMGSPCDVTVGISPDQKYKIIFEGFPTYPAGSGVLELWFPQDAFSIGHNSDIVPRELMPQEILLFNGKKAGSKTALVHTNIFADGHPCLGSGASAVHINDLFDLSAYTVASALRINMSRQSFISPTTRKYGTTPAEMQQFKVKVRAMLKKSLGDGVMELDYEQIYSDIREYFNDQYKVYTR